MSEAKRILTKKGHEAVRAGRLFLDAICGEIPVDPKGVAITNARESESGRRNSASVVDAEFEAIEEKGTQHHES